MTAKIERKKSLGTPRECLREQSPLLDRNMQYSAGYSERETLGDQAVRVTLYNTSMMQVHTATLIWLMEKKATFCRSNG